MYSLPYYMPLQVDSEHVPTKHYSDGEILPLIIAGW